MDTLPHHQSAKRVCRNAERLPDDVILKIVIRLPVRSIIQFSFVSKRWHSLLTDLNFTKSHYQFACKNKTLTRRILMSTDSQQLMSYNLKTPDKSPAPVINFKTRILGRRIMGSYNGLICLAQENLFTWSLITIWNPVIGFTHTLPDPYFYLDSLFFYGFGYVSATDDYKVLLGGYSSTTRVQVFSLRANSWKELDKSVLEQHPSPNGYRWRPAGVLLNETLHFTHPTTHLLAFDLAKDEFRSMCLPEEAKGWRQWLGEDDYDNYEESEETDMDKYYDLGVCGGCLCLVDWEPSKPIGLWVMKKYGVPESWTKLYNFEVSERTNLSLLIPLLVMETSSVLAQLGHGRCGVLKIDHQELEKPGFSVWYGKREKVEIEINNFCFNSGLILYEETLLWINGCDEVGKDKVKRLHPHRAAET